MNKSKKTSSVIEGWVREHGDYLYGYACSRLNGDTETARDMVQEALIAAWKSCAQFKGESSHRTWLIGILKHKIIDHFRQMGRLASLSAAVKMEPASDFFGEDGKWHESPRTWHQNPETLSESNEFYRTLQKCLDKLPEVQKRTFCLRELGGESTQAVCKNLDISSSNFHVLMHRARIALRGCLDSNWFGR
ncbi:MAG: sigma-70 family RNA polymerase sigma factor [Mariprofundaceae bacterium]|nr:sigma-70 family RNA polymerase sigma factor [Mariprofundaceae bacterium]